MSTATTALVTTPLKTISNLRSNYSKPASPQAAIPSSPGTFRHPQLTEIIKRQSTSSLSSQKIQNALINFLAIGATYVFHDTFNQIGDKVLATAMISSKTIDTHTLILLLRLLFITNMVFCLRPILPYVSRKDDIVDIPLTPSQRALLGLAPSNQSSPATEPGSVGYVTPPRYRRDGAMNASPSNQGSPLAFSTGRRSTSANFASPAPNASRQTPKLSPAPYRAESPSARTYRRASDSPFAAPPGGNQFFHRAVINELHQSTFTNADGRFSFGNGSSALGFGRSSKDRSGGYDSAEYLPGTPSPNGPKRQQGVNYKWLYDKGARLPRSESTGF